MVDNEPDWLKLHLIYVYSKDPIAYFLVMGGGEEVFETLLYIFLSIFRFILYQKNLKLFLQGFHCLFLSDGGERKYLKHCIIYFYQLSGLYYIRKT